MTREVPDGTGDPVCWLHVLCPECGAVPDPEHPDRCWRCGAARPPDDGTPPPLRP